MSGTTAILLRRDGAGGYSMAEKFVHTEIGEERLCSQCQDYWPNTPEYFYHQNKAKGILMAACKACYLERRYPNGRSPTTRCYAGRAR